jgi:hypothetical protein
MFQRMVSPADAAAWLENNEGNRKLRRTHVDFLARIITSGQWRVTHQGIAIGKSGRLLDGQHRLRAIVKANMTVPIMVASEVDDDLYKAMDAGVAARSISELLNTERRSTTWCTTMLRMMLQINKAQTHEIEILLECFSAEISAIYDFARARAGRKTSSAVVCSAALLKLSEAKSTDSFPDVLELIRRGIEGDLSGAAPVTVSFYKQVTEGPNSNGGTGAAATFSRAWVAFNPANFGLNRIQINDPLTKLVEARRVFHKATAGIFQ